MNYEQKYKEALERMKSWAKGEHPDCFSEAQKAAEFIFPELKESEGERIRKAIIRIFKGETNYTSKEDADKYVAWLEKQNEKKNTHKKEIDDAYLQGVCDAKHELEKQSESTRTNIEIPFGANDSELQEMSYNIPEGFYAAIEDDRVVIKKIELKFKVGDWIVQNDNGIVSQITKVINGTDKYGEYRAYEHTNGYFAECFENEYHLWTINDAKDGDVLHSTGFHNDCIFIFNGLDNWRFDKPNGDKAVATGYCCLSVSADKMEFCIQGPDCIEVNTIKPATKIQRDLLFQKMKEAGYEWDAEKKELKTIESKKLDADEVIEWLRFHIQVDEPKIEYNEEGQPLAESFIAHAEARCTVADEVVKKFKEDFKL